MATPAELSPRPATEPREAAEPLATGRLRGRELLLLALLALAVRAAAAVELFGLPTLHVPLLDEARYEALARELLATGGWPREAFYQDPLYPYAVALVYAVAGPYPALVRLLQILVSALTVPVLGAATAHLAGRPAGLAAGTIAAVYAPFLLWAPRLHKPTLLAFVSALALLALAGAGSALTARRRHAALAGAGLALGAAALLAGSLLLLVPVVAAWAAAAAPGGWRRGLGGAVLVMGGAAVAVAPATAVNLAHGEPALTATSGGVNFWIGNARGASGLFRPLGGGSQDPVRQAAEAASLARALAPDVDHARATDVSRVLAAAAWRDIAADPGRWLRLLGRKMRLFWSGYEVPESVSLAVDREHSRTLRLAPGWTLLAALALPGLVLLVVRRRAAGLLLAALVGTTMVAVVLFFVFGRFRQAAAPFLLPAAGVTLAALVAAATPRRTRLTLAAGVVATATLVALPPLPEAEREQQAVAARFGLASAGLARAGELLTGPAGPERAGRLAAAEAELVRAIAGYDRVLATDSGFAVARAERGVAWMRLGSLRLERGDRAGALAAYDVARGAFGEVLAAPASADVPGLREAVGELLPRLEQNRRLAATPDG